MNRLDKIMHEAEELLDVHSQIKTALERADFPSCPRCRLPAPYGSGTGLHRFQGESRRWHDLCYQDYLAEQKEIRVRRRARRWRRVLKVIRWLRP